MCSETKAPAAVADDVAVSVRALSKMYRIYDRPSDRLKEALHPLRRRYHREFWALRDVDLVVRRGETVGVIGVNGSGKSTLLQLVCGVLRPTAGEVRVNGAVSALLELGSGFNPQFTGRENIYLQGAILGLSKSSIDGRYQRIVAFADIGDFINQPVKTYSSGMLVRLAFSIAINVDPRILVVDEALSVGDVFFQAKCFHRIAELRRAGVTVLVVSHDMSTVRALSDRVVLLDKGAVVAQGDPKATVETYFKLRAFSAGSIPLEADAGASSAPVEAPAEAPAETPVPGPPSAEPPSAAPAQTREASEGAGLRYGNGKARLVDYVVNGHPRCREITAASGEQLEISLTHAVSEKIANPIIGIMIVLPNGNQLFGNNTSFNNVPLRSLLPGQKVRSTFRQRLHLNNGQYLITLTIAEIVSDEVVYVDRCVDAVLLNVTGGPFPYSGVCNLEGTCRVELAP